jgi:hypothetical protein
MVGLTVSIPPADWARLQADLKKFNPALTKDLRLRLRTVGDVAAAEVIRTLRLPAPDGGPDDTGGREALADATKVSVSFSKNAAAVKITTSAGGLAEKHKALLHVYNLSEFRHPVFGQDVVWVTEHGRPYFESAIQKVTDKNLAGQISAALDEAITAIGGHL